MQKRLVWLLPTACLLAWQVWPTLTSDPELATLLQTTIEAHQDFGPGEFRVDVSGLVCPLVTRARLEEFVASPGPFYAKVRDVDYFDKKSRALTFEMHGKPADGLRLIFGNNGITFDFDRQSGQCNAQVRRADSI